MLSLVKKLFLILCLSIGFAFAQPYMEMSRPTLSLDNNAIQGSFGGSSNQVNRDIGDVPGNRYNADLFFDYHSDRPGQIESRFTVAGLINDQSLTMYSLQEAYMNTKGIFKPWDPVRKSGDNIKVGRQILPWSTVDSTWGFGKVNNRRNFDFFTPGQEGLIGLTYENKSSNGFFWKAFGSPIYVPELNPGLDIDKKNKTITTRHAWGDAPASTTAVGTAQRPIEYNVDYPEISEVVNRYSGGLNAGWENKHWVMDGFYIRKPENQISIKVRIAMPESAETISAYVTPQFYYHDVYGANLKYRNKSLEMYVSGIAIRPNDFPDGDVRATEKTELKTEKRREDYVGAGISRINDKYGYGLNYVARLSPFDRIKDSLAPDPRWNQAVGIFLMRNIGRRINLFGDFKYDMLTTDRLVMLRAGYNVSKELLLNFGVNMIGTPTDGRSYWSPFTNNDAVLGGLRYLF